MFLAGCLLRFSWAGEDMSVVSPSMLFIENTLNIHTSQQPLLFQCGERDCSWWHTLIIYRLNSLCFELSIQPLQLHREAPALL